MSIKDIVRTIGMLRSEGIDGYFAHKYDEFATLPMGIERYKETAERVAEHISEGLILEIGPGPGYTAIEMAKLLAGVEIVGLDASKTMLEIAGARVEEAGFSDRITLQLANAAKMPFPDGHFDFVVSTGSLHEWTRASEVLGEIHRVLKHSSGALIVDLRRDAPQEDLDQIARAIPSALMRWGLRHSVAESYTRDNLMDLLRQTSWSSYEVVEKGVELSATLRK